MPALLKANGRDFDPDSFFATSLLTPDRIFRKGEPTSPLRPEGDRHDSSRIVVRVSSAGFDDFDRQIDEAIIFLREHGPELERLVSYTGVEAVWVDFGLYFRDGPIHCDYLPPELVRLAGRLGLGLEVSHYWTSEDARVD